MASQSGLTVVATYLYPHEADLARSQLDAEGVEAWLLDEHQIQMTWHMSGPLGGVKVAVAPADAERATELLGAPPLSGDQVPNSNGYTCAACGSADVEPERRLRRSPIRVLASLLASFVVGGVIPFRKHETPVRCQSCGAFGPSAPAT